MKLLFPHHCPYLPILIFSLFIFSITLSMSVGESPGSVQLFKVLRLPSRCWAPEGEKGVNEPEGCKPRECKGSTSWWGRRSGLIHYPAVYKSDKVRLLISTISDTAHFIVHCNCCLIPLSTNRLSPFAVGGWLTHHFRFLEISMLILLLPKYEV